MDDLKRVVLAFLSEKKIQVLREDDEPPRNNEPYCPVLRWLKEPGKWEYTFSKSTSPLETIHFLCTYHDIPKPPDSDLQAFIDTFNIPKAPPPAPRPTPTPQPQPSTNPPPSYRAWAPRSSAPVEYPLPELDSSPWRPEGNDYVFADFGDPRSANCRLTGPPDQVREVRTRILAIIEKTGVKIPPDVVGLKFDVRD
jgi:hypothetical protein